MILLVTSPDHSTHKKHLKLLFARLAEYGIIIGPEKYQFGTTELSCLGHHVCSEGISPLPSAVDARVGVNSGIEWELSSIPGIGLGIGIEKKELELNWN